MTARPDEAEDWKAHINPNSHTSLNSCYVEPALAGAAVGSHYQFERTGYFCVDRDSTAERLVFNRTVPLRDSWAKIEKAESPRAGGKDGSGTD